MMKRTISIFILITLAYCNLYAVDIVPLPYKVKVSNKSFTLQKGIDYERLLMEKIQPDIKALHVGIRNKDKDFDATCSKLGFFKEDVGNEGYELFIDNNRIVLAANSSQGIFYGKQSLIQLIRSARDNKVQGVHIIDKPALKHRGLMDDISRGPVPSKEYMMYQIRSVSELKLNMLCYYTEHIVQTKKHPEFAPPAGGITIDEWKEISDYAQKHYVELVPNFRSLGHAEKVLLNPKYRHLAESNTMYSPTNPETVQFMQDIYNEMCPAFESKFFHVNCDETFDLGRGASKKLADSIGVGRVYAEYMNKLADILRRNDKRMMMWGDIVLQHPDILDILPSDAIMMSWEYSDYPSFAKWIDPFVNKGFDYMVCTGVLNSYRLFPDYQQAIPNIRNFIREGAQKGTMGVLNTIWDDGGLHSFDRDWYGVAFGAEHSWNPNDKSIEDFDSRLSAGIYRGEGKHLFEAIHKLVELGEIQALDRMNELVFWKTIIPERGKYNSYSLADWEDVHEACLEIDSILQQGQYKTYLREYAALQIVSDEYKYLSQAKLKLAEASDLYSQACFIQFENKDEARKLLTKARTYITKCRDDLSKVKNDFDAIWKNENRDYWHNFAMDPFDKLINDYTDVLVSFDQSVKYFEQQMPLAAPADIRLDIRELQGSYFTYWLLSPAFNLESELTFETDFLQGMGGEQTASPFPGFSFFDSKGQNIKWMKYSSPLSDRVSLNTALESKDKAISYAYCTLESPDERTVTASFGISGGIEVFCNGTSVFKKRGNETMLIDEFQCPLNLTKGRNKILLKLEKGINSWDLSFKIKDSTISSSKNKYRIQK